MELSLDEMTTLIHALDKYIQIHDEEGTPPDVQTAIKLHNALLAIVRKEYPDADILKPYHYDL